MGGKKKYINMVLSRALQLSVLANWLRKPLIMAKLSPRSPDWKVFMMFLVFFLYCFIVYLCVYLVTWPYIVYLILLWHKVPLNTNKGNQTKPSLRCQFLAVWVAAGTQGTVFARCSVDADAATDRLIHARLLV